TKLLTSTACEQSEQHATHGLGLPRREPLLGSGPHQLLLEIARVQAERVEAKPLDGLVDRIRVTVAHALQESTRIARVRPATHEPVGHRASRTPRGPTGRGEGTIALVPSSRARDVDDAHNAKLRRPSAGSTRPHEPLREGSASTYAIGDR